MLIIWGLVAPALSGEHPLPITLSQLSTKSTPLQFSLDRYARDEPETPAAEVLTEDEREVIGIVVRGERLLPPAERGRPYPPDIRSWVVLRARIAGWQPSMRRPLPGNEVLWRAYVQLQMMVRARQAARAP